MARKWYNGNVELKHVLLAVAQRRSHRMEHESFCEGCYQVKRVRLEDEDRDE